MPCILKALCKMADCVRRKVKVYPRSCIDGCNIRVQQKERNRLSRLSLVEAIEMG